MAFSFSPQAAAEYQRLFDTCVINLDKLSEIKPIVNKILSGKGRYEALSNKVGIPWLLSVSLIVLKQVVISINICIMVIP
jgi:lysozyme family protein